MRGPSVLEFFRKGNFFCGNAREEDTKGAHDGGNADARSPVNVYGSLVHSRLMSLFGGGGTRLSRGGVRLFCYALFFKKKNKRQVFSQGKQEEKKRKKSFIMGGNVGKRKAKTARWESRSRVPYALRAKSVFICSIRVSKTSVRIISHPLSVIHCSSHLSPIIPPLFSSFFLFCSFPVQIYFLCYYPLSTTHLFMRLILKILLTDNTESHFLMFTFSNEVL